MIRSLIVLLFVISCAHKGPSKPKLFPYGTYQHEVNIEVEGKKFQVPGINRWTETDLMVVALGAFDVTLLKYKETFKNNKKEIYLDQNFIPMSEAKALMYLSVMKDLYSLDRSICERNWCKKSFYGQDFYFDLNDKGDVSAIRLSLGKANINIKVVGYEKIL